MKNYFFLLCICVGTVLVHSAFGEERTLHGDKPCVTEIEGDLWVPDGTAKGIYGEDDRIDVYQESDPLKREWAASTCAVIANTRLTFNGDGTVEISGPARYMRNGLPACDDEPFANQPTAANCTAFMVGEDLIVTAGHCFDTGYFNTHTFIFGFDMVNATVPVLHFDASQVYRGVEIISRLGTGNKDHCVVRVDKRITASGARPFPIRREGNIEVGTPVGIIGHPAGLAKKIGFGNTYVRSNSHTEYFIANVDAFSGNSGSPVINSATGHVEGILVRGDTDFVYADDCFRSFKVPNDGGRGEEITKTTVFASHVPDIASHLGTLRLDSMAYHCNGEMGISVTDADLSSEPFITVTVHTLNGDMETVILLQDDVEKDRFKASIQLREGIAEPDSGFVEVSHGEIITVRYVDEENYQGELEILEAEATVDCMPPLIESVEIPYMGGNQARVTFKTDKEALGIVHYGLSCNDLKYQASGVPGQTSHTVNLTGLSQGRIYLFKVEVIDLAGNSVISDNDGICYKFSTLQQVQMLTEYFNTQNEPDIMNGQATFIPGEESGYYHLCYESVSDFPVFPAGEELYIHDDDFAEVVMDPGLGFKYYGSVYDRFFVGSNGYITFEEGDTNHQALPSQHFLRPRISAFMCDLNPQARGSIRVLRMTDRYCVTYENIPLYDGTQVYPPENRHDFQIELFFNGIIRITWKALWTNRAIVGLSGGLGAVPNFQSIHFTGQTACSDVTFPGEFHSADTDGDWRISTEELSRVIQYYQEGYHCDSDSADGFAAGAGSRDCQPHDSDYMEQDWEVSLSELLRLIQLHNARGYRPDSLSEDGYAPLP